MKALDLPASQLSQEDITLARETAKSIARTGNAKGAALDLQINGSPVAADSYLGRVISSCLEFIAEGKAVAVLPVEEEIGTQEAADILKVSRPYLVKLLDAKAIPSRKVGVQRRLKLQDVLAYKAKEKQARMKVLAELAAEGQRLNLGE